MLKEVLWPFVAGLLFLTQMFFVGRLLAEAEAIFGAQIRLLDVGRMLLFVLPSMLAYGLPVGFLLGILIGLGRMGDDQELVALSATGSGPHSLLPMPLLLSVVGAAALMAITCWLEPLGLEQTRLVMRDIITRNLAGEIKPGVFYQDLSDLTIYATEIDSDTGRLRGVLVEDAREAGNPILVLAQRGRLVAEGKEAALSLHLEKGELHRSQPSSSAYALATFEEADVAVMVEQEISRKNRFRRRFDTQTPWEILERYRWLEEVRGQKRLDYLVEVHRRFAHPFVMIALALVGVGAAGGASGKRKTGKAVALVWTLSSVVAYFVIQKIFTTFGNRGVVPAWLASWAPVIAIAAVGVGLILFRRARGVRA